jgi:hypothetical protein
MRKQETNPDPLTRMGYETRDVSLPTITKAIIWFFVFGIVSAFVTLGIYLAIVPPERVVTTTPDMSRMPPQPVLQANPRKDIVTLRAAEEKELTSYREVDAEHAHIPITRAMELQAQKLSQQTTSATPVNGVAP